MIHYAFNYFSAGLHVLLLLFLPITQGADQVLKESEPEWLVNRQADLSKATENEVQASGGYHYLLDDVQIDLESETQYTRRAVRLHNASGVESFSRLLFNFEPSYQTLRLHRLHIHRDGQILDRLADQKVDVREQENRMEQDHYNGLLTAELLLRDIRIGDILEWATSTQGRNPIFNGRVHESFGLSSTIPKRDRYIRVVFPSDSQRTFVVRSYNSDHEEIVTGNDVELNVHLDYQDPIQSIEGAPGWYFPYPWFEVSEYPTWTAVVEWALPLYSELGTVPTEVQEERNRIAALEHPEEQVAEALRFVQKTLRYVSVSSGIHTHKPYPMGEVLARRFGDCKDKALLLSSLLQSIGIEAWPALVHTTMLHTIADSLPTPTSFDHVVVAVELEEGELIWVDPTRSEQLGPLNQIFTPAYGQALIIRDGESGLRKMKGNGHDFTLMHVDENFHYPETQGQPVILDVVTTYKGYEADKMRSYLESTSLIQIQKTYREYYEGEYGETIALEPLTVTQDKKENWIMVHEKWSLPDPWNEDPDWEYPYLRFKPSFADQLTNAPSEQRGKHPYAIAYPNISSHSIRAYLPFEMQLDEDKFERETSQLRFSFTDGGKEGGKVYWIDYLYHSKAPYVPVADLEEHIKTIKETEYYRSYRLAEPWTYAKSQGSDLNKDTSIEFVPWIVTWFFASIAAGIFAGLPGDLKHRPPLLVDQELLRTHSHLQGIKGWTVLPIIGLSISWIIIVVNFLSTEYTILTKDVAEVYLFHKDGALHLFGSLLVITHTLWFGMLIPYIPLQLFRTFRKSRRAPSGFIRFYFFQLGYAALTLLCYANLNDIFSTEETTEVLTDLFRSLIVTGIWATYFYKSVSVKLTFLR